MDEMREQLSHRGLESGGTASEMQERLLSAMLAEDRDSNAGGQSVAKRARTASSSGDGAGPAVRKNKPKVFTFNDAVHGHITLPAVCVAVMDTPQFQRLKDLKQLGGVYYAYSCASHNRFEHSIGTAHLGGKLALRLREIQPELGITDADVLCVQLAGLCHDLGHGPCSHMFEHFLETTWKAKGYGAPPSHEYLSTQLLDYLIEDNGLAVVFEEAGLSQRDITFIKEMIDHPVGPDGKALLPTGRDPDKHWLAQIISNERCGIDVDKFDYFMRDARQLGIACGFDPNRLMLFTRVMRAPEGDVDSGQRVLAFKESEAWNIYELFHARCALFHAPAFFLPHPARWLPRGLIRLSTLLQIRFTSGRTSTALRTALSPCFVRCLPWPMSMCNCQLAMAAPALSRHRCETWRRTRSCRTRSSSTSSFEWM